MMKVGGRKKCKSAKVQKITTYLKLRWTELYVVFVKWFLDLRFFIFQARAKSINYQIRIN